MCCEDNDHSKHTKAGASLCSTSRRDLLVASTAGLIGASGFSQSGLANNSQSAGGLSERLFTIEYGDTIETVSPFSGNKEVESVYNYNFRGSGYYFYSSEISLQKTDTARLFLYDGPNGLSLGAILDTTADRSGGSVTFETVLPDEGQWVVKDDPADTYGETVDWAWNDNPRTDGGVFRGGLDGEFEITITPRFNQNANRDIGGSGTIDAWEFVYGEFEDGSFQNVETLSLMSDGKFQPVTIRAVRGILQYLPFV